MKTITVWPVSILLLYIYVAQNSGKHNVIHNFRVAVRDYGKLKFLKKGLRWDWRCSKEKTGFASRINSNLWSRRFRRSEQIFRDFPHERLVGHDLGYTIMHTARTINCLTFCVYFLEELFVEPSNSSYWKHKCALLKIRTLVRSFPASLWPLNKQLTTFYRFGHKKIQSCPGIKWPRVKLCYQLRKGCKNEQVLIRGCLKFEEI